MGSGGKEAGRRSLIFLRCGIGKIVADRVIESFDYLKQYKNRRS